MNMDGRRHDCTSTTIPNVGLFSNNFGTLASLAESDDSRTLRGKEDGFLNLNENYIKNEPRLNPGHRKINIHWISLCRLYEAAKDRPVLRVENTRSNCLFASSKINEGSYEKSISIEGTSKR